MSEPVPCFGRKTPFERPLLNQCGLTSGHTRCAPLLEARNDEPLIRWGLHVYRGTSLTRKRTPLGPYRRPMPRVLWWS